MKKKYIDSFYNDIANADEKFKIFSIALPLVLLYKNMYNESEHFIKESYDLLPSHLDVLCALNFNEDGLSPTELYDATVFSSGGMTKVLKKLQERGYIVRKPMQNDKRSNLVCITALGKELVAGHLEKNIVMKEKMFEVLSKDEKTELSRIFEKVTRSLAK